MRPILFDKAEDPRRRLLISLLSTGFLTTPSAGALAASLFGDRPARLPAGQSIFRIEGQVTVNGKPATLQTRIAPGDVLETGPNSEIVFVVGAHSMIARANTRMTITPQKVAVSTVIAGLRILAGRVLSVSRNSPMQVNAPTVTIGVRGTGFYIEADPEQTYFCTCYGTTEVSANSDPDSRRTITAAHHDQPLYILAKEGRGRNIRNAPLINHTDQELMLIETLVGRSTPFVFPKDAYNAPRRNY